MIKGLLFKENFRLLVPNLMRPIYHQQDKKKKSRSERDVSSLEECEESGVLPVDLLGPLGGVSGQRVVDGDARHLLPREVADHVIHRLELLLEVVCLPRTSLGIL